MVYRASEQFPLSATPETFQARVLARRTELREAIAKVLQPGGRLVWEIGCGHGHFLNAYAAAHPAETCIGVDLIADRIDRAERKRNRAKLRHLHFLKAEAQEFLDELPAATVLSAIYVLFPDPWPKRRHHKNRIMQPDFLRALAARAGQGTRLYFRTDHRAYFNDVVKVVERQAEWVLVAVPSWPFELATIFQQKAPAYHSLVLERAAPAP